MQFLTFLYHNVADFTAFAMSEEFLQAFALTLFPDVSMPQNFLETSVKKFALVRIKLRN